MERVKRKRAKSPKGIEAQEAKGQTLSREQLVKLADVQWSKLIKSKAACICEWCGAPGVDSHHMVARGHQATRFLLENGVCLCKGCHLRFHNKESITGWNLLKEKRYEDYQLLIELKDVTCKMNVSELRKKLEELRKGAL